MEILGVTGSMGMGKSTVSAIFRAYGFPVFDADNTVKQLQQPNGKVTRVLSKAFPEAYKEGKLDRTCLRQLIVKDKNNLQILENITLPLVTKERENFIKRARARHKKWCILDIPLLFETNIDKECDKVIVVNSPRAIQKYRIIKRGKITWEQALVLIESQLPNREKCRRADYIIQTGLSKAYTYFQVKRLLSIMKAS
ncbi:Dephospho-CoA kinase [Commensalibacter sp. Nvir]|uniref:dephospho-CoA kinase n=1 Tax=Commensalibacter sp. Nvir TaxID=3069817 RepID=UPI002D51825D|nr:Dephospho-CoA kinase [Commensalibacter sp. Nvir]